MSYLMTQTAVILRHSVSFLYPLFLLGALAVAIPIVLHLFRRRTEIVVDFPAVRLLQKAPVEHQRRRRLRELILLALRVERAAACWPSRSRGRTSIERPARIPAPVTVVALDTSLSLSAPGQFAPRNRRRAARSRAAPATHTVALVTFADSAITGRAADHRSRRRAPGDRRRHGHGRRHAVSHRARARGRSHRSGRAASSSSPICSRWDGKRATKAPCPMASRSSRSRSRRRRVTWR